MKNDTSSATSSAASAEATETMLPCPFCAETDVDATYARGADDQVNAGCMSCGMTGPDSHSARDAADRWNALPRTARSATVDSEQDKYDAERYRFIRAKLCNRESLEFDRFPNVMNLAGLASIKPSEIDTAVDLMREEK